MSKRAALPGIVGIVLLTGHAACFAQSPIAASAQNSAPASSPLPGVSLDLDHFLGSLNQAVVQGARLTYGGELTLQAGLVQGSLLRQQYDATIHVRVHEADTTLTSRSLHASGSPGSGTASNALLTQMPYTVRADQLNFDALSIVAHGAEATTAPPDKRPDLSVRAQTISLFPERNHGEMRNASLYLFRQRLLTVPRIGFSTGNGVGTAGRQAVVPTFGVSGRYGTYLAFGGNAGLPGHLPFHYRLVVSARQQTQVRATSQQTLYRQRVPVLPTSQTAQPLQPNYLGALRKLATVRRPPLPVGDPLLFHDFLPDRNPIRLFDGPSLRNLSVSEEISTHQEAVGRRQDNIYVSREPEATLSGALPLSAPAPPLAGTDPNAFRHALHQVRFVAFAQASLGEYREERPERDPVHVQATRQRDVVGLTTEPLLAASNFVILPQVQITSNVYSGQHHAYKFVQFSIAASRYFSDRNAVGVQYLQSGQSGDSPFDFDHLDTTREIDFRAQIGSHRRAIAGLVRYDLVRGGVIDYKLAVAAGLEGITPVLSYNFRNRSIGLGVEVEGITF